MCVGVPMKVVSHGEGSALCEVDGELRRVSTLLLRAEPAVGDHLLIHGETAIRAIEATEAALIADALRAVMAAAAGDAFDHLIADLVDREPLLPEHLRGAAGLGQIPIANSPSAIQPVGKAQS